MPEKPEQPDERQQPSPQWSRQLRRYGPIAAIGLGVVAVAAAVVIGGDSDDDASPDAAGGAAGGYTVETATGRRITLPEGVVTFSAAEQEGLDIDWPETCDSERGVAAVPNVFSPECVAPFEGDNGGATAPGVTEDTITVVVYLPMENDPVMDAILGLITQDDPADLHATYEQFLDYFHEHYETYGREVELVPYEATGTANDEAAARADAAQIAEEIQPFAVLDGPQMTGAFEDELGARGVLNIGYLGGAKNPDFYSDTDPYLFQLGMGTMQLRRHLAEYIGKRLAGEPAEHAGDDDLAEQERRFGLIYIDLNAESEEARNVLEDALADYDVELAAVATYQNPLDVSAEAPGIIAQMKDADVTSVILVGDPLTPGTFTRTATDQDFFPEWIVSGSALTDTTVYARTYDQDQWANAFGITSAATRRDPEIASGGQLFRWYTCSEPPAPDGVEVVLPMTNMLFTALQYAGPELTHEGFRDALFDLDPTPQALSSVSLSWGAPDEMDRWDALDYQGVDDATEIWWDADASGPDELGAVGDGMYSYVDGGARFLPRDWPSTPAGAFDAESSVALYTDPPPGEADPDYPSPCE